MKIQREAVIATALELLDQVGIEGLTMRRLADALDIKAASLYWHFANKQELLNAMADALIEGVARIPNTDSWEQGIIRVAREMRRALLARRDGARVYAGTYVITDNVFRVAESLLASMREAGGSNQLAGWSAFSVLNYVLGFVMEEQGIATDSAAGADLESRRGEFAAMAQGRFPCLFDAIDAIFDADFDARFESGLELIVAGLAVKIGADRKSV
jgi:TetR/AcrR family tetracycline transcriptional repressor